MAVTLRFQSSGAVPGDGHPIVMRGPSLTIGRGPENDVVLPDPDRMISKTHCVVENHNGSVVVVDFSTNGTFLNYGKVALGRTATPINDGDVLIMGGYELVVEISTANSRAEPLAPLADERASFGNARAAPDPYKLLDDAGPGGDFLDSLLGSSDKPRGPGQFRKEQENVELLPSIGDDGPLLGPAPVMPSQPAMRNHSASVNDSFLPAQKAASKSVIPDDWDDLLALTPPPSPAKQAQQALAPGEDIYSHNASSARLAAMSATVPDDDIFGDFAPAAQPAAPPPNRLPTATLPEDDFLNLAPTPAAGPGKASAARPSGAVPDGSVPTAPGATSADVALRGQAGSAAPDAYATQFDPFATDPNHKMPSHPIPAESAVLDPILETFAAAPVAQPQAAVAASAPVTQPPLALGLVSGVNAARAFLVAVGAEDVRISDAELPDTMARLGRTLKSMITGLREILMTRTSIKSEFRIEQTMVNVGGNNPLKFSVSPEQAIEAMVRPTTRGYLAAEAAAAQALEDIKAHEIAMMTGMEAALKGVLAKLDPAILTAKIEAKGGFGAFFSNRKAQYWETYETMYAEISDQAQNDFHELFAREFSQAYRAQLARLKEAKSRG